MKMVRQKDLLQEFENGFPLNDDRMYREYTMNLRIQLIEEVEFRVKTYHSKHKANKKRFYYQIEDQQRANLADIESEIFDTLEKICCRLEGSYFVDYGIIE